LAPIGPHAFQVVEHLFATVRGPVDTRVWFSAQTCDQEPAVDETAETFLTIGFEDGTETRFTLGPPGEGNRVAVGSATNRSSIWRMFTSKSQKAGSDVFITAAALGSAQKISLHESGVWRNAWHSEDHAAKYGFMGKPEHGGDPRVLDRWQRPEGRSGWSRGLSVWVPYGHLAPSTDTDDPTKPVTWVPEPRPGELVGLHFVVAKPDQGELHLSGMFPVCGFRLRNSEAAIVVMSRAPVDEAVLREHEQKAREAAMPVVGQPPYKDELRIGVFGHDSHGHRFVWDLSLQACFREAGYG
jgi:hypothetical protein